MINTTVDDLVDELIHGVSIDLAVERLRFVVYGLYERAGDAGTTFLNDSAAAMSLLKHASDGPAVIARIAQRWEVSGD